MEIEIRQAFQSDIPSIVEVIHRAFNEYKNKLYPPSGAHSETTETINDKMIKGGAIVVSQNKKIIGCALWRSEQTYIYIGRLAVLPDYRKLGIGSQLLSWIENQATNLNFSRVQLGVRIPLPELQKYYENKGYHFVRQGTHEGYNKPTYIIMEKKI